MRALDLEPRNQQANLTLAHIQFFLGRMEESVVQAERAIALNPNDPELLAALGLVIHPAGSWARGLALANKAINLFHDPPWWTYYVPLWDLYRTGKYSDALAISRKSEIAGFFYSAVHRAAIHAQMGSLKEARQAVAEIYEWNPQFDPWSSLPWMGQGELLEAFHDGLRKAGLDIPLDPPKTN